MIRNDLIFATWWVQHFKGQPHKMVKDTQTIRWQEPTNCLSVFDHFVELVLKALIGLTLKCLVSTKRLYMLSAAGLFKYVWPSGDHK